MILINSTILFVLNYNYQSQSTYIMTLFSEWNRKKHSKKSTTGLTQRNVHKYKQLDSSERPLTSAKNLILTF